MDLIVFHSFDCFNILNKNDCFQLLLYLYMLVVNKFGDNVFEIFVSLSDFCKQNKE